jgi:hypothetical protein
MVRPRIVLLIFVSGKVVLTGMRTEIDVWHNYSHWLVPPILLLYFRCQGTRGNNGGLFQHLSHIKEIQEDVSRPALATNRSSYSWKGTYGHNNTSPTILSSEHSTMVVILHNSILAVIVCKGR